MKIQQKSKIIFFLAIINSLLAMAQQEDDIFVKYGYTIKGDSEADITNYKFGAKIFSKPLKGGKGIITARLIAAHTNISYNATPLEKDLDKFYNFGFSLSYLKMLNKKWSYLAILKPQLSSNFTSNLTYDDFNPSAFLIFNYSTKPSNRLSFGLGYVPSSSIGIPFIPYLNYWKRLNDKTTINLGFPETSYNYKAFEKTTLSALVKLEGFNYNISDNFNVGGKTVERVSSSDIKLGLGLKQEVSKTINLNLNAGYTLNRNFNFVNDSLDKVVEFDMKNNFSFSVGIGINLNTKKQQQKNKK